MQANDQVLAIVEIAAHPFDLVGIDVRRAHLDRRRQVDDQLVVRRRLHDLGDRVADLQRHLEFRAGEALRRILEPVARMARFLRGLGRHVGDHLGRVGGDLLDPGDVLAEHHAPLQLAGGIVEMHDRIVGAFQRLEGPGDQFRPALHQHLQRHVVRHVAFLDAPAREIEVGLRGGREADLDFLEPHLEQQAEHPRLALRPHRVDQRLVAVAQIDGTPDRRLLDLPRRPGAVGNVDGGIGSVFLRSFRHAALRGRLRVNSHGGCLSSCSPMPLNDGGQAAQTSYGLSNCDVKVWQGALADRPNRPPGAPQRTRQPPIRSSRSARESRPGGMAGAMRICARNVVMGGRDTAGGWMRSSGKGNVRFCRKAALRNGLRLEACVRWLGNTERPCRKRTAPPR